MNPEITGTLKELQEAGAIASYMSQEQKEKEDLIRYQLETEQIVRSILLEWQGLKETENGEWIPDKDKLRLLNSKGAAGIYSFVYPRLTKIVSLSNLDEEIIKMMVVDFMDVMTYFLVKHFNDYEIASCQVVDSIIELFGDMFYVTLMKAYEAGERDSIRKQYILNDSRQVITDRPQAQQQKGFNPFNLFK